MGFTKTSSSQQLSRQITEDSQRYPTKTEMLSTSTPDTQIQVWNEKRLKNNNEIYSRIHSHNERFLTTGLLSPGDDLPQESINPINPNPFTPIVKCSKGVSIGHGSLNLRREFYGTNPPVSKYNYNPSCYMWVVNPVPGCTYHWKVHGTGPGGSSLGHLENIIGEWTRYHTPTLCVYAAWGEIVSLYTGSTKIDSVMVQVDNASYYVVRTGPEAVCEWDIRVPNVPGIPLPDHHYVWIASSVYMVWFEEETITHSSEVVYGFSDYNSPAGGGTYYTGLKTSVSEQADDTINLYWPAWWASGAQYAAPYNFPADCTHTFNQTYVRPEKPSWYTYNAYIFYNANDINNQARVEHHKPYRWAGNLT